MPPPRFWPLIAGGGIAQIVATVLLISAFDARGFAVGTVYSKTEVVQVAVFSAVLLNETLRPLGWLSTVLCLAGVVLLAGGRGLLRHADRLPRWACSPGPASGWPQWRSELRHSRSAIPRRWCAPSSPWR